MNKSPLLIVLLAALALAGAATWLLTREPPPEGAGSALQRAPDGTLEKPSFHMPAGEIHTDAAEPARVESLAAPTPAPSAAPSRPAGPVRRISGHVVRLSDGSPLGGPDLRVARVQGEGERRSAADGGSTADPEDGGFTLTDVPLAEAEVCVSLVDGWPRQTAFFPLPDVAGDIAGLELTFDSGFQLSGTVTDSNGAPLAGASASIEHHKPVTSDSSGRFELRDVTTGKDRLSVDVWAEAPWFARDTRAVAAPADSRHVATVQLQLQGSGAIEGHVTDPQGKPVEDAEVSVAASISAQHAESGAANLKTTSGADGHYRLDHVPEGRYLVTVGTDGFAHGDAGAAPSDPAQPVAALLQMRESARTARNSHGLAPRWIPGVEVTTREATTLDVELDHGAVIEGRITDPSGARIAGAKVTLERLVRWPAPEQNGSSISFDGTNMITSVAGAEGQPGETVFSNTERTAETGEDGGYRFEVVSAGDKRLTAIDAQQLCAPKKSELAVAGTELHSAVDFVLDFGLSLRGRVTDPGGAPLEGVSVNVKPQGTQVFTNDGAVRTDAEGWFQAVGLAEGPHSLMLNLQGYSYRFEQVLPGEVPRTWILTPAPKVHGFVLDAVTNAPILRFSMTVSVPSSIMKSGDADHPDGQFAVDVDDDTPCSIGIDVVGYESETKEGVIPSSTASAPLRFRLKPQP